MTEEFSWPIPLEELTDGVVTLRCMQESDKNDIVESCRDPRTQQYTHVPSDYTPQMADEFIANTDNTVRWAIEFKGRYCGVIELRLVTDEVPAVSVGYWTSPWARGQGLQSRALKLVSAYAFAQGVHRIEVKAATNNPASRHVAESAGYTFEGVQRHGECLRGQFNDLAVYSLLATDN
ncbi:MAG: GNAT family protein [Rothia sp. (in: high G+C Gram-positive bacteria)]|nr:GNAT family protein [Rothia sp. (in: high G+C Gram-positive bacteria)]